VALLTALAFAVSACTAADADFFGQTLNPALIAAGVQVMNNSWGGIYWDTTDTSINQAFANAYQPFVVQHGGLVVFAAGNDSKSDPSAIAALPSLAPELEKGWLVTVAVNSNHPDQLASYSNACGKAMDYCLAAPGDVIVLDKDTLASTASPSYWQVSGTSLAAPQVSGAAAVVWQARSHTPATTWCGRPCSAPPMISARRDPTRCSVMAN